MVAVPCRIKPLAVKLVLTRAAGQGMAFLFGHFVANDTTHGGTGGGAQQATTDDVAGDAANHGTGGGAFFLVCHAGTATQAQGGQQKYGSRNTLCKVHESSPSQLRIKSCNAEHAGTDEKALLNARDGKSVRLRTQAGKLFVSGSQTYVRHHTDAAQAYQ